MIASTATSSPGNRSKSSRFHSRDNCTFLQLLPWTYLPWLLHFFSPRSVMFHTMADWYGLCLLYKHQWLWAWSSGTENPFGHTASLFPRVAPLHQRHEWHHVSQAQKPGVCCLVEEIWNRARGLQDGKEKEKEGKAKLLQTGTHKSSFL